MSSPHDATKAFEAALCYYTGAPFAVAVSSCTAAIELCLYSMANKGYIEIPKRTYVGVAQSAVRCAIPIRFVDLAWSGGYQLKPYPIWDYAKRFTSHMYQGGYQCVSFHCAKILGDSQGGAILHDNDYAHAHLRKLRFDGRTAGVPLCEDEDIVLGHHCYMSPDVATRLHARLVSHSFPQHNPDQCPPGFLEKEYSDLSELACFKPYHSR